MSKAKGAGPAPTREINEGLVDFLATVAKLLLWIGVLALVAGVGFLIYTAVVFSGPSAPGSPQQALSNIAIFDKFVIAGVLALAVGSTYLFWGESFLAALQIMGGAVLFFAPYLLGTSGIVNTESSGGVEAVSAALAAISRGGLILLFLGLAVLGADLFTRVRQRANQGWKADQTRYGKGVKEEVDRHNVFLGKCWQLPFCRKFVRERCPIYHSRRTCWKELTGCMCEEEVIRNAMENKPIPKDALMASSYIPRNMKLTVSQKQERCRSCVIYNEHQKHKYKAAMPLTLLFFVAIYFLLHGPLIAAVGSIVATLDKMIGRATYVQSTHIEAPTAFQEMLLVCILIVGLAYAMRLLEYLIFKLKI